MDKERLKSSEEFFRIYKPSVDNDGVLANTRAPVVEEFNRLYGTDYKAEDIRHWQTVANWALELGMSWEEALEVDKRLWYDPDILFRAEPIPGALDFTFWFRHEGIELAIITSRPHFLEESTVEWYKKWMPWIKPENIYIQETDEMDGDIFKIWTIKLLKIGIHFEDALSHAEKILTYTDAKLVFLSDLTVLDYFSEERFTRISGKDGRLPNMQAVNQMFLKEA